MSEKNKLPLREISIGDLFCSGEKCTYEVPVYQRNYAWEQDEISALIRDVNDSFNKDRNKNYYIGTLVAFNKGDRVYEVIDGQQRLTTIYLILQAIGGIDTKNKLTYRARKKSDDTLKNISDPSYYIDEKDPGIENGLKYAREELNGICSNEFKDYFLNKVHIIKYTVPRDIDLNHYFEIMNSRGEQLEKHEIIKAQLMEKLGSDEDSHIFHKIWAACCEMNVYLQQKVDNAAAIFSNDLYHLKANNFDELGALMMKSEESADSIESQISIADILSSENSAYSRSDDEDEGKDTFQPIIDFPNFLLIVLKLVRLSEPGFDCNGFNLDDKELINEFDMALMDTDKIKRFAYTLFKAKFLLDNYIVHHSKEDDRYDSNPWKLQVHHYDANHRKASPKNLIGDPGNPLQDKLVHLLSMFEVAFTARQRKNYLLYCLMYLMNADLNIFDGNAYADFLENLASRYFYGVYMVRDQLSDANKPKPGSFDSVMINGGRLNDSYLSHGDSAVFESIYGKCDEMTNGIPLFIFNYMDYKIWKYYDAEVRGEKLKENSYERRQFFQTLGCGDFGLKVFVQFYFSRTRKSLEHYYPQNQAGEGKPLLDNQINCFGNFAMIGSEANSSGSDWSPHTKLEHYLDSSKKISNVSVASLKFMIMMQVCKDKGIWLDDDIREHQEKMLALLLDE